MKRFSLQGKDACIPWEDDENDEGWLPAVVSRTTHRKYVRRKARRDALKGSEQSFDTSSIATSVNDDNDLSENCLDPVDAASFAPKKQGQILIAWNPRKTINPKLLKRMGVGNAYTVEGRDATDVCTEQLDNLDIKSETGEGLEASFVDDESSEQSWALRSLAESTVACITSDYAMQNVILQIGLPLLAPGGMQIRQLHRWVLRCHACYKVKEIGKIFCPKCGNGGTLRKVSVTVVKMGLLWIHDACVLHSEEQNFLSQCPKVEELS